MGASARQARGQSGSQLYRGRAENLVFKDPWGEYNKHIRARWPSGLTVYLGAWLKRLMWGSAVRILVAGGLWVGRGAGGSRVGCGADGSQRGWVASGSRRRGTFGAFLGPS